MAKYDLTGSLEREFDFNIGSETYIFRKPTVREMRELSKKFSSINKETDEDEQGRLAEDAMTAIYDYIRNANPDGRPVGEVIDDQPISVQIAFNDMIRKEIGTGQ